MSRRLDDRVTVSGQLQPGDVAALAADGVTLLINNRPDGEEPGQPGGSEIARAAQAAGLGYVAAPYQGRPTPEAVLAIQQALQDEGARVHAFCRSGMRSSAAWALAEAKAGRPIEEILTVGREAGYDLAPLFV